MVIGRERRRGLTVLIALACAAQAASAVAQPAAVAVRQVGSLDAWLAGAAPPGDDAETDRACSGLGAGPPPAGRIWLGVGPDGLTLTPETGVSADAVAYWTEAVLGARDAAQALYGADSPAAADFAVMLDVQGGVLSMFDGLATRRLTPCAAMRRAAAAIAGAPPPASDAAGLARAAPIDAAPIDATPAMAAVTLRAGGAAEVLISGADLPAAMVLRGPDGVQGEILGPAEDGALRGALTAAPDAPPVRGTLRLYAPDDPFTVLGTAPLNVIAGGAPTAAPTPSLVPGASVLATAPMAGEAAIPLTVAQDGEIALQGLGVMDMAARLIGPDGAVIAANDDGGVGAAGYGFALRARLAAGEYRLMVGHCCGGGGTMTVSADLK